MNNDNPYAGAQTGIMTASTSMGQMAPNPQTNVQASSAQWIKDTTTAQFKSDVMQASMEQPVLVDFWAPWCGPCKQMTPVIEAAVTAAGGKIRLVKMNIDEHPEVAGQLGVQSIPAVFAFANGRPVDAFTGALPQNEIAAFIEKVLKEHGSQNQDVDLDEMLEHASAALKAGDTQRAAQFYTLCLQQQPQNLLAIAGLAECYIAVGHPDKAANMVSELSEDLKGRPEVLAVLGKIEMAEEAAKLGDIETLLAQAQANAADPQSQFDAALSLAANGRREEAIDRLIALIKLDREWNDDGARKQLLKFFEAWGPMDAASVSGRRKLSAILFS